MTDLLGDRYQIGETLGFGGMSEVHRGRDLRLGRDVAIKVLRADLARDPSFQARFRREAQNAASLNHPAIVAVYDTGETRGETGPVPYIVMEHVDGQTLRDILRKEGPLPAKRAMEIMADVCAALDFSHRHGIVHRDVKPANIMLTKAGAVKVMDFGIARAVNDGQSTMTATAAVIGTAQYLSPEQARGESVDARSDVYATGCVLFELLAGVPPFTGDSPVAIAYQHVREDAKAPSETNKNVPAELDAIVLKALNKNPMNRYQTAAEMRSDMVRALSGQAVHATPVMSDDERTELMRATPARTQAAGPQGAPLLAPPSRITPIEDDPDLDGSKKAKRVWGFVGVGALCVAVLAAAIWVTVSVASQKPVTPEQPVPSVVGMTRVDAEAKIKEAGFNIDPTILAIEVVDDAQVDKVQEQNPSAGTVRPTSELVKLTIGKPRSFVTVPNVIGQSPDDAKKSIEDAGLVYAGVEDFGDEGYKGRAQKQDPPNGGDVAPGTTVTVTIGKGREQIVVPDWNAYNGRPYQEVEAELTAAGFVVTSQPTNSFLPQDAVVKIEGDGAAAGANVPKGSPVTIFFSDNSQFQMPDLALQTPEQANQTLITAGWTAGTAAGIVNQDVTDVALIGKVVGQNPATGTAYPKVGTVTINVGVAQQITVAPLEGLTVAQGTTAMYNNGWAGRFNVTLEPTADPNLDGKIKASDPTAGTSIDFNSRVNIVVYQLVAPTTPPVTPPVAPPTGEGVGGTPGG